MSDIVLSIDEKEVTVSTEAIQKALPKGDTIVSNLDTDYVSRADVNSQYVLQATFDNRFKNWTPKNDAHKDPDVIAAVLSENVDKTPDIDEMKTSLRNTEVKPLEEKLNKLTSQLSQADVRAGSAKYFDDPYITPAPNGAAPWAESALKDEFTFNEDYGYTVAMLNGAPIAAQNPTNERPYRGVDEHLSLIVKDEKWSKFARPDPKGGGGSGDPGGKGGSKSSSKSFDPNTATPAALLAYGKEHGFDKIEW